MIISRIMDMSRTVVPALDLVSLPRRQPATVSGIDWTRLALPEARRLLNDSALSGLAATLAPRP